MEKSKSQSSQSNKPKQHDTAKNKESQNTKTTQPKKNQEDWNVEDVDQQEERRTGENARQNRQQPAHH
jgi:hypothetical protein